MTNAISGFGTLLKIGDGGGPENFTAVSEVVNISGPGFSRDLNDATHQQSPGGWEEVIAGIKRSGEVTLECNYLPADATQNAATGVLADFVSGVRRNFQLVFPDAGSTTWSFAAFVQNFEPNAPVDDKLGLSVTLKLTGQPTLA